MSEKNKGEEYYTKLARVTGDIIGTEGLKKLIKALQKTLKEKQNKNESSNCCR